MTKPLAPALLALGVAACATPSVVPVAAPPVALPRPAAISRIGLERVLGQDARSLVQLFGKPDMEFQEGPARKMQFGSGICVLDAYLYPPPGTKGTPVVTHVDARQRDGSAIDRASCVAALTRREGGK